MEKKTAMAHEYNSQRSERMDLLLDNVAKRAQTLTHSHIYTILKKNCQLKRQHVQFFEDDGEGSKEKKAKMNRARVGVNLLVHFEQFGFFGHSSRKWQKVH